MMKEIVVYTIGHSNHPLDHFVDLLQQHDTRRFCRVTDNLNFILQFPLLTSAQYQECVQACKIDFAHFTQSFRINDEELQDELQDEIQPYLHAILATTLVHEATHGVISARGIPYDDRTRVRIEKRCAREERLCWRRLASRLDVLEDHPELDACFEYDEQWYEDYWQEPAVNRFQILLQRTCGNTGQQQSMTSEQKVTKVGAASDH